MKTHVLKIKRQYYDGVFWGIKRFELRKNDRDYQVGDEIHFIAEDGNEISEYLSSVNYLITDVLKDVPEYGLMDGYCVLSIAMLYKEETK